MKTMIQKIFLGFIVLMGASTLSAGVKNGADAPAFTLKSASGEMVSLSDFKGKYVVLEWVRESCPFVRKFYNSGAMQGFQSEAQGMDVVWLSIDSTDADSREYMSPEKALAHIEAKGIHSTWLMDSDSAVAKAYGAKRTPHCFIISPEGKIIYQGAIDSEASADPKDIKGATNYVIEGLKETMAGKPLTKSETRPYGCGIKY